MLLNLYTIVAVIIGFILFIALDKTKAEGTELGLSEWLFVVGGAILWPVVLTLCLVEYFVSKKDEDSSLDN